MHPFIRTTKRPTALAAAFTALLVMATALATASVPAAADGAHEVTLRLEAPATFHVYNADEGAKAENASFIVPVAVVRSDNGPARNVEVTIDTSGLAGVARAGAGGYGNCKSANSVVFTCTYGTLQNGDGESNAPFTLHGVDGVKPGDSGTVTYTATADNAAPVTGITRMTVGGPSLASPDREETVKGLEPGESLPLTPRFANHGQFPTRGDIVLQITAQGGLLLTSRPDNCYFTTSYTSAWCRFPTKAAPGTAYRTSAPIRYTAAPRELTGTLSYSWSHDSRKPEDFTTHGTGAPFTLTKTADSGDLTSGGSNIDVETTVQVDYEPVTATVRGRVGDTVKVRLGLRDHGPGRMDGNDAPHGFEVVPPEGTTITSIPYTFEDSRNPWACPRPKKPGGAFGCDIGDDRFYEAWHEAGVTAIDFYVRIDRQVPGARGTIRTYNPYDRTPGNDTAVILLDASPAPSHPALRGAGIAGAVVASAVVVLVLVFRYRRLRVSRAS